MKAVQNVSCGPAKNTRKADLCGHHVASAPAINAFTLRRLPAIRPDHQSFIFEHSAPKCAQSNHPQRRELFRFNVLQDQRNGSRRALFVVLQGSVNESSAWFTTGDDSSSADQWLRSL